MGFAGAAILLNETSVWLLITGLGMLAVSLFLTPLCVALGFGRSSVELSDRWLRVRIGRLLRADVHLSGEIRTQLFSYRGPESVRVIFPDKIQCEYFGWQKEKKHSLATAPTRPDAVFFVFFFLITTIGLAFSPLLSGSGDSAGASAVISDREQIYRALLAIATSLVA